MKITGTGSGYEPSTFKMPTNEDGISKSIQSRIDSLQKQLSELSENDEMDPKQKLKKKEELNQQITELNQQLNQRRLEKEREKQEKAAAPERRYDRFERGGSAESMSGVISAGVAVGQAEVRGGAARSLEGRVNVLKSEIKQDGARGVSTEQKQAAVSKLSARAESAVSAQSEELGKAAEKLTENNRDEKNERIVKKEDTEKAKEKDSEKEAEKTEESREPSEEKDKTTSV